MYRRDDTPIGTRHKKARAALQRLAMVHTIELDEGRTEPRTDRLEPGVNIKDDSSTTSGIRPHITMSRTFVRELMGMCTGGFQSLEKMYVMRIKMALAFDHDIAVSSALSAI